MGRTWVTRRLHAGAEAAGRVRARPLGLREGAQTHFSKLKSGKRMLFLMKMVKFSASIMMGLWAGTGGRGRGNKGAFTPGTTLPAAHLPECMQP